MIVQSAILREGIVYVGKRHSDILNSDKYPMGFMRNGIQGFITNEGVFVTREEAAVMAFECGQIPQKKKELYSEDLY